VNADSHASVETLSAFLDGELDPAEGRQIQAHVDACASCSARVADFARISSHLTAGQPGFPEGLLVSSFADGEVTPLERRMTSSHLASCADCRGALDRSRATDLALRSLPMLAPSARTDAYVAGLGGRSGPTPMPKLGWSWAIPRIAIAAVAVALVVLSSFDLSSNQLAQLPPEGALVAAIQQAVFNPRTNTLYVLDVERGEVAALDASTRVERARIVVGGRPSALALNATANTVLVLDGGQKRLTEIDASNNTVVSAGRIDVSGTPTSMRIDPQGRIVVSSVLAASTATIGSPEPARAGQVTVLDSASKQVESVKNVDVAPSSVVFDPIGKRALLLSTDGTTVADAATYLAIQYLLALRRTWFLVVIAAVAVAEPILLLHASRKPAGFAAVVLAVQALGAVAAFGFALRRESPRPQTAVRPEPA